MSVSGKKKGFTFPPSAAILFFLLIIVAAMTYIVPAGEYDRAVSERTGRTSVVSGSYHSVPSTPVSLFQLFVKIAEGFVNAADVIFLIMFAAAWIFSIVRGGAFDSGISALLRLTKGKEQSCRLLSILVVCCVFRVRLDFLCRLIAFFRNYTPENERLSNLAFAPIRHFDWRVPSVSRRIRLVFVSNSLSVTNMSRRVLFLLRLRLSAIPFSAPNVALRPVRIAPHAVCVREQSVLRHKYAALRPVFVASPPPCVYQQSRF
jgi:hypothetical protein